MFGLMAALILGGGTGLLAERFSLVSNGYVVSICLGIGGAVALWFLQGFFGFNLGFSRGVTSILGAISLLFLAKLRR